MENKGDKAEKDEKDSCCESDGCGCGGGGRCGRCCPGKAALVLVLLLVGGLIGYGIGRCSAYHKMGCHYVPCPMGAPMAQETK